MNPKTRLDTSKLLEQIDRSRVTGMPILICLVATKACFIKFAGLVRELDRTGSPFLAIASGQHYDEHLTTAADELGYRHLLSGSFDIRGDLIQKSSALQECLSELCQYFRGLKRAPILVTCGDTLTAAIAPFAWYLLTGQRSIHIEAGLRSMQPKWEWSTDLLTQRTLPWSFVPTRPFPEGLCTRMATCASQQLMAPVERNVENLVEENYDPQSIFLSGSPSVDALDAAIPYSSTDDTDKRLRVDVHRRENLNRARLSEIFSGLHKLRSAGIPIEFVVTNSMRACEGFSWDQNDIKLLEEGGIVISHQWTSYLKVISFLRSSGCLGVYTDSGGLQEECCVLGVPCMTCRFDTDRPETVMDFKTNILIPPRDSSYISDSLYRCLTSKPQEIWPGLGQSRLSYGSNVARRIVDRLKTCTFESPTNNLLA